MRFEYIAGALCLDFANTIHDYRSGDKGEELRGIPDLLQWAQEAGLLSSADRDRLSAHHRRNPREAAAALARAVALRDLLLSIFAAIANRRSPSRRHLFELNSALARVPGRLRVSKGAGRFESRWISTGDHLEPVLFAVLADAAELLASDRLDRLRECASPDCTWFFMDESRNRTRRWCDMAACGNRMKARRHYRRLKAAQ